MTEAELFDSMSRTTRFCLTFYHIAYESHETLWLIFYLLCCSGSMLISVMAFFCRKFVKQCLHGFLLAASIDQHVKYADRLHIYGKDHVELLIRHNNMIENIEVSPLLLAHSFFAHTSYHRVISSCETRITAKVVGSMTILGTFLTPMNPHLCVTLFGLRHTVCCPWSLVIYGLH